MKSASRSPRPSASTDRDRRAAPRLVYRPLLAQHRRPRREAGGFAYISDTYDDDLPYWRVHQGRPQLIIPYTLSANDMRFVTAPGFDNGEEYFQFLKDSFDCLYAEGQAGSPKMMSLGLHCRLVGQPGRYQGLKKFVDYIKGFDKVWVPTRLQIAEHWAARTPLCRARRHPVSSLEKIRLRRPLWLHLRAFALDRRARLGG
jgi:peptidoglycan/xylan/chitin deacetylase (PgdA/CDA1 family)